MPQRQDGGPAVEHPRRGANEQTIKEAQAHIDLLELRASFVALQTCISVEQPAYSAVNRQSHGHSLS